jgi:hypothetical protein
MGSGSKSSRGRATSGSKRSATLANLGAPNPEKDGKKPNDGGDLKDGGSGGGGGSDGVGQRNQRTTLEDVERADQAHVAADMALFATAAALATDNTATPRDRALARYYVQARALVGHTFRGVTAMPDFNDRLHSGQPLTKLDNHGYDTSMLNGNAGGPSRVGKFPRTSSRE